MQIILRLKSRLYLDVYQVRVVFFKINASKYLNTGLILLAFLLLIPSKMQAEDTMHATDEVFMEVIINQQSMGIVVLLRSKDQMFAASKDLRQWRLSLPVAAPINHYGEDFYAIDALAGLSYKFDESSQALMVQAPSRLFDSTILNGEMSNYIEPTLPSPGGFFNYDLTAHHAQEQIEASGLLEVGGFGGWGATQTSILVNDLGGQASATRLNSIWSRDHPMKLTSLRFGDAISGASSWGGTVRYGGLQWGSNFSIQPELNTFPLPKISGEATLPSTVDFYVDDIWRMSREVPSGPFTIQDLPVMTGQGDARLVVRDILGREQIITQSYYTSPHLLKQGLQDYSYELGFERRNFGAESSNYGRPLAVGTHRMGITEQFTGEIHAELLSNQQAIGLGGVFLWPGVGVASGSFAMSNSKNGVGGLLALGFNRKSRNLSFVANTQLTNQRFKKLGQKSEELIPQQINKIFVNLVANDFSSFEGGFEQQIYIDRKVNKLAASYVRKVGKLGKLRVSINGDAEMALSLNFSVPLGKRTKANLSTSVKHGRGQVNLEVSRSKSKGNGVGYRLVTDVGASKRREAVFDLQNEVGNYSIVTGQSQGKTTFRGSARGGVAFLGGSAFLSRRIKDSFAVVHVPGYSDVGIYAENQLVGHTDAKGKALLPGLRAYEKNLIRIEQADLPLDAQIDAVELNAVPYFRSGMLLKFPIKHSRGALLAVVLENGKPLPAGAQVEIIGENTLENELFPTGMRGEVYLTGLEAENWLRATWREQSCEFALPFPETTDPLPHLGTYICVGVEP